MTADHTTRPLDLDAIRARADAATDGPWIAVTDNGRKDGIALVGAEVDRGTGRAIAVLAGTNGRRHADAEFIAAARTDVPALLAEVERLRGERDTMLRLVGDLVNGDDCWFDHHGGCQAHGYLSLEPGEKCPQQEAKELIEAANGGGRR